MLDRHVLLRLDEARRTHLPCCGLSHPPAMQRMALDQRPTAHALSALAGSEVAVAEVIWTDADGSVLGLPSLLQTRVPGHVSWPSAVEPGGARAMGDVLARIHSVQAPTALPTARPEPIR